MLATPVVSDSFGRVNGHERLPWRPFFPLGEHVRGTTARTLRLGARLRHAERQESSPVALRTARTRQDR